ncbi:MAG: TonB-dependent hemoglobin/transferrin/lactoferrin family receptor, partial [Acidobacteria bacterium]|nr:TonB-dependent hemoglobin/transferrin/lactoferrin family receptor [Acidobacteriota bacterium]
MRPVDTRPRLSASRRVFRLETAASSSRISGALALAALLLFPALPSTAASSLAQPPGSSDGEASDTAVRAEPDASSNPSLEEPEPEVFLEAVTVTATLAEGSLAETPGAVGVLGASEIFHLGYQDARDLTRYEPGVYVQGDPTRLGLSGFNIRGIGGNRVQTRIDGVPTAEQFDFGPLSIPQYSIDLEEVERVEIVRSAASSLYGSDALGGVISFATRGPSSYLDEVDGDHYLSLRLGGSSRNDETYETVVYATQGRSWRASLQATHRSGSEMDNQGEVDAADDTRTRPNPQHRSSVGLLGKLEMDSSESSTLRLSGEWLGGETETEALSSRSSQVEDFDAVDEQDRLRLSVEQSFQASGNGVFDTLLWRLYHQGNGTDQRTVERRLQSAGPSSREGLLTFEEDDWGGELQLQKYLDGESGGSQLLSYGTSFRRSRFDQLRDRRELFLDTGEQVPTTLVLPTKYFPKSTVQELGIYLQDEVELFRGRLRLIPGVRYDRYDLDADQADSIYLDGNPGTEPPVDVKQASVSPKLGVLVALTDRLSAYGQYARGFRAPPYSSVNNGFTNFAGGYRTLPNPDLEPETSDNFELGLKGTFGEGSFSLVVFENHYDDFIDTAFLGFNPVLFLVEFQPRNVDEVEISGVELAGDLFFGRTWSFRGAFAHIEGENVTTQKPLDSVAPDRLVVGLRYRPPGSRLRAELTTTYVAEKNEDEVDRGQAGFLQFTTPGATIVDLSASLELSSHLALTAGLYNLLNETYWNWGDVRGLDASSPTL